MNELNRACLSTDINQVIAAISQGAKPDSQTLALAKKSANIPIIKAVFELC